MKPQPKRTATQPGLGEVKVTTDKRRSAEPMDDDAAPSARVSRGASAQPNSLPPPSGGPSSGGARHTLPLESRPETARPTQRRSKEQAAVAQPAQSSQALRPESKPPQSEAPARDEPADSKPPGSRPIDRLERDDERRPALQQPRTPIDVVTVDPKRLASSASLGGFERVRAPSGDRRTVESDADRKSGATRFPDEKTTGTRRTTIEGRPVGRPPSGRPGTRPSTRPPAGRASQRPPANRPQAQAKRAPSMPPPAARPDATNVARSRRVSIREDDMGAAVKRAPAGAASGGGGVPKLLKTKAEIAEAPIDHRTGFLLAHIDGKTTVQALVDICGMPEDDVHEILERLRRLGIVAVR